MATARDPKDLEHDPSAELGLSNPVRDQEKLGDEKFSVTPPREEVRAPAEQQGTRVVCATCSAELDPVHSYRIDADEYAYHFCGEDCYRRWGSRDERRQHDPASPRRGSANDPR
jgi:hypothetical protein